MAWMFCLSCLLWTGAFFVPYQNSVISVGLYILGNSAVGCVLSIILHRYHSDVETMQSQFHSFSVAKAKCHCCSVEHKEPDGSQLACDKEIMIRCMNEWFGSTEEFEKCVQTKVKDALTQQLGRACLPYTAVVVANLPVLWLNADFASAIWLRHDLLGGLSSLLLGLYGLLMLAMPLAAAVFLAIEYTPRCCSTPTLRKLFAAAVFCFTQLCVHGTLQLCGDYAGLFWGVMLWTGLWLVPSLLLCWFATRAQRVNN